jgi:hypothetical protein
LSTAAQTGTTPAEAEMLLRRLDDVPPPAGLYGYQLVPKIVDAPVAANAPVTSFSYSWEITKGYIEGEAEKLRRGESGLEAANRDSSPARIEKLSALITEYRSLVGGQRTIDQYIQYNRFWQRTIAEDRPRFDRLTEIYQLLKAGDTDASKAIRSILGKPDVPGFVRLRREGSSRLVLRVPVYTDIEDAEFLRQFKAHVEQLWQAEEHGIQYAVEVEIRYRAVSRLYDRNPPRAGDPIDVPSHAARFPSDGAVLTTGARFTHAGVGRYIAVGPGDLTARTLAHEFGHLLGFTDGYVRGYRDLGEQGFEILELTSFFGDIMSSPREGRVQGTHFRLIVEGL